MTPGIKISWNPSHFEPLAIKGKVNSSWQERGAVFLQHFKEVSDHINRSVYLSLRSDQVSKFYHNSSDISSRLNGIDYLVASQRSFTSLKDWSVTLNSFVHTDYNANASKTGYNLLAELVRVSCLFNHSNSTIRGTDLLLNITLCHLKFKIYRTALLYSLLIWQRLEWRIAPRPDALRPFSLSLAPLSALNFFWSCWKNLIPLIAIARASKSHTSSQSRHKSKRPSAAPWTRFSVI